MSKVELKMNKGIYAQRVSQDQRELLLQFMMEHAELIQRRVTGIDVARRKRALQELTCQLNAMDGGATKSIDKWWKCWQDWRCDTKAKALRLRRYSEGTVGGPIPTPLTKLEETLLQFCGVDMVLDDTDPLKHTEPLNETQETHFEAQETLHASASQSDSCVSEPSSPAEVATTEGDSLEKSLERQTAALERLALGIETMGQSIQAVATAIHSGFMALATAIENKPHEFIVSMPEQKD